MGPLTLSKARDAALRKRLEREQDEDPQLEKRKKKEQATRERLAARQAAYTLEDRVEEYVKHLLVQDCILNHVNHAVSAIHDHHRYDAEARVWLQRWADHLEVLTTSNVVPLHVA